MDSEIEEVPPPAHVSKTGPRSRNSRAGSSSRKKYGRLCSEQSIPVSLTKECRFAKINDVTSDRVIAYAGDFIMINCTSCKLPEQFLVEPTFECFEGGELAALVQDWNEDSKEVWARPQVSSDGPFSCSGPIYIFGLDNVSTIDNHVVRLLQTHAFTGFIFTSTAWICPFVTSWMGSRRKDSNLSSYEWDSVNDPKMKLYKSKFLETLPCCISRFDVIKTTSDAMFELKFISELELSMINLVDETRRDFEFLVLQFLPEVGSPNFKHVNVVFVSNWRTIMSKSGHDDWKEYLLANLWYFDRFDFEDLLFQLASSIVTIDSLSELKAAYLMHDVLVSFFAIFSLSIYETCVQLNGVLGDAMSDSSRFQSRYNHKTAIALWLHQNVPPDGAIVCRDGKRSVSSHEGDGGDDSPSGGGVGFNDNGDVDAVLEDPSPPDHAGSDGGASGRRARKEPPQKKGARKQLSKKGLPKSLKRLPGSDRADALENLIVMVRDLQDNQTRIAHSIESIVRNIDSHLIRADKKLEALVASDSKLSNKIGSFEVCLKKLASTLGQPDHLGARTRSSHIDEAGNGSGDQQAEVGARKGKRKHAQITDHADVEGPGRNDGHESDERGCRDKIGVNTAGGSKEKEIGGSRGGRGGRGGRVRGRGGRGAGGRGGVNPKKTANNSSSDTNGESVQSQPISESAAAVVEKQVSPRTSSSGSRSRSPTGRRSLDAAAGSRSKSHSPPLAPRKRSRSRSPDQRGHSRDRTRYRSPRTAQTREESGRKARSRSPRSRDASRAKSRSRSPRGRSRDPTRAKSRSRSPRGRSRDPTHAKSRSRSPRGRSRDAPHRPRVRSRSPYGHSRDPGGRRSRSRSPRHTRDHRQMPPLNFHDQYSSRGMVPDVLRMPPYSPYGMPTYSSYDGRMDYYGRATVPYPRIEPDRYGFVPHGGDARMDSDALKLSNSGSRNGEPGSFGENRGRIHPVHFDSSMDTSTPRSLAWSKDHGAEKEHKKKRGDDGKKDERAKK